MKLIYMDGIQKLFAGFFLPSFDSLKHNKLERIYDITVDGFADKFVLGEKMNDRKRKALWNVKITKD